MLVKRLLQQKGQKQRKGVVVNIFTGWVEGHGVFRLNSFDFQFTLSSYMLLDALVNIYFFAYI